jgi:hypothetical protein
MAEKVVCYQLRAKFVDQSDVPENARQVFYYSLAIGHHVGVLDCLSAACELPIETYRQFLSCLPESAGREKLAGVLKWGEIEINPSHLAELGKAIEAGLPDMIGAARDWSITLLHLFQQMQAEPAVYLMLRSQ